MGAVLIGAAVVAMLAGVIFYNRLRRKLAGVIGVGGSYIVLIGLIMLAASIGQLLGGVGVTGMEIVMGVAFAVIGVGYMVYVMIVRCHGAAQRILLPFAAILIAFGFCWRFLGALVLHIPMESGRQEQAFELPQSIMSPDGENFRLENAGSDNAQYYCARTGQRANFNAADFEEGYPSGWYQA